MAKALNSKILPIDVITIVWSYNGILVTILEVAGGNCWPPARAKVLPKSPRQNRVNPCVSPFHADLGPAISQTDSNKQWFESV